MKLYQLAAAMLSLFVVPFGSNADPAGPPLAGDRGLAMVKNGTSPIPIVVFKDAPPYTRQAADELANYVEKVSGARPEVLEGTPDPIPDRAVWVGYQPVLGKLFPGIDFGFKHPEEILLAANANYLVLAGRDRWNPDHMTVEGRSKTIEGKQLEYGTANAVYTFLRDCLNVRWLWPGPSGEDVIQQATLAFEPFEYRYHPQLRARSQIIRFSALGELGRSEDWCRRQRLLLDSLNLGGGHAFSEWFKRFHDTKPELFALQPDGTRSGWPGSPRGKKMGRTTKLCQSNPEVWKQWLADVEEQRKQDPNARIFNASPNDSVLNGICVCENCVALDHPDGAPCEVFWQEAGQEYVALSDRFITFANRLARMLKARYPDEDLGLSIHAYSQASSPPPVAADPDENVIITYVGHYPWCPDEMWERERKQYLGWVERGAEQMAYRPNVNQGPSRRLGLPSSMLDGTLEVFKLLGENNCVGVFIDTIWEHWAARAPEYYLMSQLAWNPTADGRAVLHDYYQRGFGPAAPQIEAYWALLDDACQAFMNSGGDKGIYNSQALYTPELMAKAGTLLDEAAARVKNNPKLADRVAFIRAGYKYAQLILDNIALMDPYLDSGKQDEALASRMRANWDEIKQIFTDYPMAINALRFRGTERKLHPDFV